MNQELEDKLSIFIDDFYINAKLQHEDITEISGKVNKNIDYSKNLKSLSDKQDSIIKNQEKILENISKKDDINDNNINEILVNNIKDLNTNSKELIEVNKKLNDKLNSGYDTFYYLGSVIIGFLIGYVVIHTFLQLAFDN